MSKGKPVPRGPTHHRWFDDRRGPSGRPLQRIMDETVGLVARCDVERKIPNPARRELNAVVGSMGMSARGLLRTLPSKLVGWIFASRIAHGPLNLFVTGMKSMTLRRPSINAQKIFRTA